ncbi:MAG: alanine/glycine:cation symporter family protein [Treponema sp.]
MAFVNMLNYYLWTYILIILLLASGVFYTLRGGFPQFRLLGDMIKLITGTLPTLTTEPKKESKHISAFQSFCISVASHVGTGNLAGVAIAVVLGGPGALFWMWITALLGCATSLVENTLAQVYKEKDEKGHFRGGPAYYIEKALGLKGLGKFFSVIVILTFAFAFNTVQANTIAQALEGTFHLSSMTSGIIIAALTGLVIFGGIHRIAKFSSLVVPVMALGYVMVAIVVLIINAVHIPALFSLIVKSAFGLEPCVGAAIGTVMLQGVKRGLYSNEAGMGSAPNAAATSHVSHPAKQGLMQAFGVFVDTILICSATGFIVLLLPDYANAGETGIKLTQIALSNAIGSWGNPFITVCVFLFAFSSIIGNYYYGETNLEFLTKHNTKVMLAFRLVCIAVVYAGSVAALSDVWDTADLFMGVMAIINIIVIAILSPKAFTVIQDYIRQRKAKANPEYHSKNTPSITNVEVWN